MIESFPNEVDMSVELLDVDNGAPCGCGGYPGGNCWNLVRAGRTFSILRNPGIHTALDPEWKLQCKANVYRGVVECR